MSTPSVTLATIRTTGQTVATQQPWVLDPAAYAAFPAGKRFWRQGDLYFRKLAAVPPDALLVPPYPQLAPGSTLGSRHCLDHLDGLRMYHLPQPTALDGPIVETWRAVTITHPEHGHVTVPAGAIWQVTYQRAYSDEVRRVVD